MKHLEDEDIAGLIDGTVTKKERETFLKHLSECETCLSVYSETLKFIEEEEKEKEMEKFPFIEKIKTLIQRFWQATGTFIPKKVLVPVAAVLIFLLIITPFLLNHLQQKKIRNAQVGFIASRIMDMESVGFAPTADEKYAAVRAGVFVQDLSLLVETSGKQELQVKIAGKLSDELDIIFKSEATSLFPDLEQMEKKNLEKALQHIRELLEEHSLSELFQLGCFVEQTILSTFADERPQADDIRKYLPIARKHQLPVGVSKDLKKLKVSTRISEIRELSRNVRKIFYEVM